MTTQTDETVVDETLQNEEAPEQQEEQTSPEGEEDYEEVVSFDGDSPSNQEDHKAPEWVRDLRKKYRNVSEENRKLKEQVERYQAPQVDALPPKPTIEDFDFVAEDYEVALERWFEKKREHEAKEADKAKAVEAQQQEWNAVLTRYNDSKSAVKASDFEVVEEIVSDNLTDIQKSVILAGADNPALLVYALGKNSARLEEVKAIKDPIKLAFALAKLEGKLKVDRVGKTPPEPEKVINSGGGSKTSVDAVYEALLEEAQRTGNRTKVVQYLQSKRGN